LKWYACFEIERKLNMIKNKGGPQENTIEHND